MPLFVGPDYNQGEPELRAPLYTIDPDRPLKAEIETVSNATIIPLDDVSKPGRIFLGGVLREDGSFVENSFSYIDQNRRPNRPPPAVLGKEAQMRSGKWLYGGRYDTRFGHFLVDTVSRLWALDHLPFDVEGVVFIQGAGRRPVNSRRIIRKTKNLYDLFTDLPVPEIIVQPTKFETLLVPPQGCGAGDLAFGCPEFRDFAKSRFSTAIEGKGDERLYISRTGLDATPGQVVYEQYIEDALSREGYTVFHPQTAPIEEQIARIRAAKQIIGVEGSAFHLVAYAAKDDCSVGIIRRRQAESGVFAHCGAFLKDSLIDLDAWKSGFVAEGSRHPIGNAVLDFGKLTEQLKRAQFVSSTFSLPNLTPEEEEQGIIELSKRIVGA